ncbi:MAG: cytochrome c [Acidiferrobacterales bacterium]
MLLISIVITGLLLASMTTFAAKVPGEARKTELLYLLKQDCGSCHGLTLKGGLGPALTPQALAGKSVPYLVQTILAGRPGTPMPPWDAILSTQEASWLVNTLKGRLSRVR